MFSLPGCSQESCLVIKRGKVNFWWGWEKGRGLDFSGKSDQTKRIWVHNKRALVLSCGSVSRTRESYLSIWGNWSAWQSSPVTMFQMAWTVQGPEILHCSAWLQKRANCFHRRLGVFQAKTRCHIHLHSKSPFCSVLICTSVVSWNCSLLFPL